MPAPTVADRLAPFGTTIFAEMTALALRHNAINLSQGFPDFDGPAFVKEAAKAAMDAGHNQYARTLGVPALNEAIAAWFRRGGGRPVDPTAEVTVTSGCTEALAACFLGLLNPGNEVILFEPYYDSYRAGVALAGGVARFITLRPGQDGRFAFDEDELSRAFGPRTRALVLNTPHNPTGKVFTRGELALIASLCERHGVTVIADEVYERLTFDADRPHVSMASLPGMEERTIVCSSLGKTFSLTGWKIGWSIAPPPLSACVRAAHQFLTFATATPLQHGAAVALGDPACEPYVRGLVDEYRAGRDFLGEALGSLGFGVHRPDGTYFIMADHAPVSRRLGLADDVAFCRYLTAEVGVAAIPPSVFYEHKEHGRPLVRFAFCKRRETLEEAVRRLRSHLG
ncbi:MAG: aminotransferase class I/II-fold pyridoxal phosphate-dependent enzyme [Phycisphaeraceae bacterium]|nr:aminotransferase class I/II-fold pyridoxal phosphate-dependent enzyme [Phycisphaeraceae bacterium]